MQRMKKAIILLTTAVALIACQQKTNHTVSIHASLPSVENKTVYLLEREGSNFIIHDSIAAKNGLFSFTGTATEPLVRYLATEPGRPFTDFFMEEGVITLTQKGEKLHTLEITGTENNTLYNAYKAEDDAVNRQLSDVYNQYKMARQSANEVLAAELEYQLDSLESTQNEAKTRFIINNKDKAIAPFLLWRNAYLYTLETMEPLYDGLTEEIKKSIYAGYVKERLDVLKSIAPGQKFIDFTMEDTRGNSLALSEMMGQYTLVDFWASWCVPCRMENPNVVNAYQKYHEAGLEIVGVSFDRDREKWVQGIKEDQLTWHHVSDLSYWDNAAGKLYGIRSIPSNFLMDKNGIILAWNLREEALREKLESLFGF
ncbi:MAG: AhpC/TSA family protein [Bacteroidia bacterium]|nr:AhpC/TSA family protein [Bacteroidia bacterium]